MMRDALRRLAAPAAVCALGLWMAFHPMLGSGLARMQTDPGDPRLVNFHQEYVYRWLTRTPGFEDLWSPPFFYPATDTAAYGDIHFANAPIYVPWRLAGMPPDTAFQFWLFSALAANFAVAYLLLRRGLSLGRPAALAGAYLYGFGLARINAMGHPQLVPGFYVLGALYALFRIFDESAGRRTAWIYGFTLCMVAQLYSGLYTAWFFGLALGLALPWALAWRDTRVKMLRLVRSRWMHLAGAAALGAALVLPMAWRYWQVARAVELQKEAILATLQPRMLTWLHAGPESWSYAWLARFPVFSGLPGEGEHRVGIGLVALVLALAGLWRERRRPLARLLLLTSATVIILATRWPGDFSLWETVVLRFVPAARAIRAPVRIGILMLVPGMFGLAFLLRSWPEGRRWRAAAAALLVLLALEQAVTTRSYDKLRIRRDVAALAAAVPPQCRSFFFSPDADQPLDISWKYDVDAMFASAEIGIPTINGNGGRIPPGWFPFNSVMIRDEAGRHETRVALYRWAGAHEMDPAGICWVQGKMPMGDGLVR